MMSEVDCRKTKPEISRVLGEILGNDYDVKRLMELLKKNQVCDNIWTMMTVPYDQ